MRTYIPDPDVKHVSLPGLDLAYLEWGDAGPLVILVHGFPDTARTWDKIGPSLAQHGFRVVAPYTRGYAPTSVPTDGLYDSDTLGRDVLHLIEALGEQQAILVGHDWGASAVYAAAGLQPARVKKLVALAIPHPAAIKPSLSLLWGARHFFAYRLPGAAKRFARNDFAALEAIYKRWSPAFDWPQEEFASAKNTFLAPGSLDAAFGYYRALTPKPTPGIRARISVPSLILGGLQDGVATTENFEASRSRFTGPIEIKMLPGGHFLHREYTEDVLKALVSFLTTST